MGDWYFIVDNTLIRNNANFLWYAKNGSDKEDNTKLEFYNFSLVTALT